MSFSVPAYADRGFFVMINGHGAWVSCGSAVIYFDLEHKISVLVKS